MDAILEEILAKSNRGELLLHNEYFQVIDRIQDGSISNSEYLWLKGLLERNRENEEKYDRTLVQRSNDMIEMLIGVPVYVMAGVYNAYAWFSGDYFDKGLSIGFTALLGFGAYIIANRLLSNNKAIGTKNVRYARFQAK
jgi:hypothetical protein